MSDLSMLVVNDQRLDDLAIANGFKLWIAQWSGVRGGVADRLAGTEVPGQYGETITSLKPTAPAGRLGVTIRVRTAAINQVDAATEVVVGWLAQGYVRLRTDLNLDRETIGFLSEVETSLMDEAGNASGRIEATFTRPDPLWYERIARRYFIDAGEYLSFSPGTGPTQWSMYLRGPAERPVVTYYNTRGESLGALTFDVTLDTDDFIKINPNSATARLVIDGAIGSVSNGLTLLEPGSRFPAPSNIDGPAPSFRVTDNDATATAILNLRRSYR